MQIQELIRVLLLSFPTLSTVQVNGLDIEGIQGDAQGNVQIILKPSVPV